MARAAGDKNYYRYVLQGADGTLYEDDTIDLPSVTHIIKSMFGGPPPEWGYKLALHGVAQAVSLGHSLPSDPEELKQLLKDVGTPTPYSERDKGAVRGSRVHGYLEALAAWQQDAFSGLTTPTPMPVPEDGYEAAVAEWWTQKRPRVIASEIRVRSPHRGYAGTTDLVWEYGRTDAPTRVITDLKTHKPVSMKNPARVEDLLQNAAYRLAWNEDPRRADYIHETTVLVACEDGRWFEDTRNQGHEQAFLALLQLYRTLRGGVAA